MARRYDSFLLRCWGLGGDAPRVEIEHVQTRLRTRSDSLAVAVAWMSAASYERRAPAAGLERDEAAREQKA